MNILEAYKTFNQESNIKVGDKVKVLREFKYKEFGVQYYPASWWYPNCIGKVYEVVVIGEDGFTLYDPNNRDGRGIFPFFVLELVEKAEKKVKVGTYEVKFKENGDVIVGCQIVLFEELEKVYKLAKISFDNRRLVTNCDLFPYKTEIQYVLLNSVFEYHGSSYKSINLYIGNNKLDAIRLSDMSTQSFYKANTPVTVIRHE